MATRRAAALVMTSPLGCTETIVSVWHSTEVASNPARTPEPPSSARRAELLDLAYQYAVQRGGTDITLRPIAAAIGSSPRVLLYLFGSKDGLIKALLSRSRSEEVALLAQLRQEQSSSPDNLREAALRIWSYL